MNKHDRQSRYNRPQKRRNIRRALAIWLIFIAAMMLISDRQQKSMLDSGRLSTDDLSSKVMGVFAYPVRGIETLFSEGKDRANAYAENIVLKEEISQLRNTENKVRDLETRVRSFEKILEMDTSSDIPARKIVARAVNESNGPFVHSALINVGSNKEVNIGHAVMNVDGLYGHVVRVGRVSSRVLLLTDLSSRVSVMSQRSQSRAILVGRNTAQPQLGYISPESDWQVNDQVVTSGDGGVLPRGLVIGSVVGHEDGSLGVRLFTQNNPVDWVWVLPFMPIQTPEENMDTDAEAGLPTSQDANLPTSQEGAQP